MNYISDRYGPKDGRYQATRALETVLAYAIERLADGHRGVITLIPENELEDITVIYKSEGGGVQIGQICVGDDDATSVFISENDLPSFLEAVTSNQ